MCCGRRGKGGDRRPREPRHGALPRSSGGTMRGLGGGKRNAGRPRAEDPKVGAPAVPKRAVTCSTPDRSCITRWPRHKRWNRWEPPEFCPVGTGVRERAASENSNDPVAAQTSSKSSPSSFATFTTLCLTPTPWAILSEVGHERRLGPPATAARPNARAPVPWLATTTRENVDSRRIPRTTIAQRSAKGRGPSRGTSSIGAARTRWSCSIDQGANIMNRWPPDRG